MEKAERVALLAQLTDDDAAAILYSWRLWARDAQLPNRNADWDTWLFLAGRGSGKTRAAAEWVRENVESHTASRIALAAPTAADARDVMVEGESGILAISPPWFRPTYNPSKRTLIWPNGARAMTFSAEEPDRFRGPQHDLAWCDELSSWQYEEAYDNLLLGLRLGRHPRHAVTTTPKPNAITRRLLKAKRTLITHSTTYDNRANLAASFLQTILERYEGTRMGRQELHAEFLDAIVGALWSTEMIDATRVTEAPPLSRIVIGVDPAATSNSESAETGIVAAGVSELSKQLHGYVLSDDSLRGTPAQWGRRAVMVYDKWRADCIVAEDNNGGEMVEEVVRSAAERMHNEGLRDSSFVNIRRVHASRGKIPRAEPISAKYEQGLVHHVGFFAKLEEQQVTYEPGRSVSPDHMDAAVWALTELMIGPRSKGALIAW